MPSAWTASSRPARSSSRRWKTNSDAGGGGGAVASMPACLPECLPACLPAGLFARHFLYPLFLGCLCASQSRLDSVGSACSVASSCVRGFLLLLSAQPRHRLRCLLSAAPVTATGGCRVAPEAARRRRSPSPSAARQARWARRGQAAGERGWPGRAGGGGSTRRRPSVAFEPRPLTHPTVAAGWSAAVTFPCHVCRACSPYVRVPPWEGVPPADQ